jgi:hypothetical protein
MPRDTEIVLSPKVRFLCGIPVGTGFIFLVFSLGNMFSGFWIEDVAALVTCLLMMGPAGWVGWHGKLPARASSKSDVAEVPGT